MDIEKIARECGFKMDGELIGVFSASDPFTNCDDELRKFANKIRNETLEEAAKHLDKYCYKTQADCAEAIRRMKA